MTKNPDTPGIFSRHHHEDREDLAGEHPFGDAGQVIAVILFFVIWGLDSFVFRFSTTLACYIPLYLRLIDAAILLVLSGYIARSGLKTVFKEKRDPPQIITTGVFGRVRHPIYLAAILFYLGFIVTTLSIISFVFLICVFLFYDYISKFEEKLLEKQFGQEYINYKKNTPKWLIRLSP